MVDDYDVWTGQACEPVWGAAIGEVTLRVHHKNSCAGRACVIHNPSDHHLKEWPLLYRGDRGLMERTCPHGQGHPDPDDIAYHASLGVTSAGVHGCDGCCFSPEEVE